MLVAALTAPGFVQFVTSPTQQAQSHGMVGSAWLLTLRGGTVLALEGVGGGIGAVSHTVRVARTQAWGPGQEGQALGVGTAQGLHRHWPSTGPCIARC